LNENPYDSPVHAELLARRSLGRYLIASTLVVAFWLLVTALLFWLGVLTVANGNVSIEYTSEPTFSTPLGDPTISTHSFYVNTFGAFVLWGGSVALSLAAVNGIIVFRRGKADA
jgi:hypothetical protein